MARRRAVIRPALPLFRRHLIAIGLIVSAGCAGRDAVSPSDVARFVTIQTVADAVPLPGSSHTITVRVVDGADRPQTGTPITFTVVEGAGSLSGAGGAGASSTVTSDAAGAVSVVWRLGGTARKNRLQARIGTTASAWETTVTSAGPSVVARLRVLPTQLLLAVGRSVSLVVEPLDELGAPVAATDVTWSSNNSALVRVDTAGVITGLLPGSATIALQRNGATANLAVTVQTGTTVSMTTRMLAAPVDLPALSWLVALRGIGDSVFSVIPVGGTPTFTGTIALPPIGDLMVLPMGESSAFPSLSRVAQTSLPSAIHVVPIPRIFRVSGGAFDGTDVALDLVAAVTPPTAACTPVSTVNCSSFIRSDRGVAVQDWATRPVPLVLDRVGSDVAITEADSIKIWEGVAALEAAVGQTLFVPASASLFSFDAERRPLGAVAVALVTSLSVGTGNTLSSINSTRAEYTRGRITLGAPFGAFTPRNLVVHELMHTMGIGHTCAWPSPMGSYGCPIVPLTARDVAMIQLRQRVRSVEATVRAAGSGALLPGVLSLLEAAQGEQMLLRGGAPLFESGAAAAPASPGGALRSVVGVDSLRALFRTTDFVVTEEPTPPQPPLRPLNNVRLSSNFR
jgi:hypothetical protein